MARPGRRSRGSRRRRAVDAGTGVAGRRPRAGAAGRSRCARPSCTAGGRPRRRRTGTAAALGAELVDRPEEAGARPVGAADVGRAVGVAAPRRRPDAHGAERRRGRPSRRTGRPASSSRRVLAWSRKRRSSPLTLKIERLGVVASAPSTPGVEQPVEQEGGVAGLGGHAGDARDVDVGALGAVEEVEVEVDRLAVAGEPAGSWRSTSVEVSASSARRRWPGGPRCPAAAARRPRARPG